jgi:hypothetical protein
MSWRYVYIVMVSACLELGWALVWNVSRPVFVTSNHILLPFPVNASILPADLIFRLLTLRTWDEGNTLNTGSHLPTRSVRKCSVGSGLVGPTLAHRDRERMGSSPVRGRGMRRWAGWRRGEVGFERACEGEERGGVTVSVHF